MGRRLDLLIVGKEAIGQEALMERPGHYLYLSHTVEKAIERMQGINFDGVVISSSVDPEERNLLRSILSIQIPDVIVREVERLDEPSIETVVQEMEREIRQAESPSYNIVDDAFAVTCPLLRRKRI